MSPHRIPPATSAASHLMRQAFAVPDAGAGVVAGLIGLAAAFWNLHVVVLLILVIAGGVVDLWAGARRARIRTRRGLPGGFDRTVLDEGISGKAAVLVALLFLGVAADSLIALAGGAAGLGIGTLFATFTPATAGLLAYRLARESSSIIENFEGTPGGEDAIWPGLKRIVDTLRFRMTHTGGAAPPERRWDDDLTSEERAWITQQLGERRARGGEG